MKVEIILAREIPQELQDRWCAVQAGVPTMQGPCFRPELFRTVGAFLPNVQVGLISDDQGRQGFWPFLKGQYQIARPIPLCDYQAIISAPEARWDGPSLLRRSGMVAWDFDHLVGQDNVQAGPEQIDFQRQASPQVRITESFKAYLEERGRRKVTFQTLIKKRLACELKLGPIRFDPFCKRSAVLHRILDWKAQRYNRGKPTHRFVAEILDRFYQMQQGDFSGILSALYAGDHLLAAHFGLRAQGVLYYWFGAFDPVFSHYSPGRQLIYDLITGLHALDCQVLDFGPGGEPYKNYFCNETLAGIKGTLERSSLLTQVRRSSRGLERSVRSVGWLREGLRPAMRFIRWARRLR